MLQRYLWYNTILKMILTGLSHVLFMLLSMITIEIGVKTFQNVSIKLNLEVIELATCMINVFTMIDGGALEVCLGYRIIC